MVHQHRHHRRYEIGEDVGWAHSVLGDRPQEPAGPQSVHVGLELQRAVEQPDQPQSHLKPAQAQPGVRGAAEGAGAWGGSDLDHKVQATAQQPACSSHARVPKRRFVSKNPPP